MATSAVTLKKNKKLCFITCAPGLERTLAIELKKTCAVNSKLRRAGLECALSLEQIYRFCLWSRVANRVLYPLDAFEIDDERRYYTNLRRIKWSEHVRPGGTIAVDFFCASSCISHSQYGAQLTKDAIVDWFRDNYGQRPSVDRDKPDIRINVYLFNNRARISLDMSGLSLHRRNYRTEGGSAPLKENLAAAILLSSRWKPGTEPLFDPMCGSATLLIEGAMIAGNIAPGLRRDYYGFTGWKRHDNELWLSLLAEAQAKTKLESVPEISGFDISAQAINVARNNIEKMGLADIITVHVQDFFAVTKPLSGGPGLLVTNPPYGERLGEKSQLSQFYGRFGQSIKHSASGWRLALFTGAPALYHRLGLPREVTLEISNGGIDCKLFTAKIPIARKSYNGLPSEAVQAANRGVGELIPKDKVAPGINQFSDRLRKNVKQIKGWAKSAGASNYRLYDADLPDYAFALDLFSDVDPALGPYLCLQEYKAPAHIDDSLAEWRLSSAVQVIKQQLACSDGNLSIKRRDRQKGLRQYTRLQQSETYHQVAEDNCKLLINIHDYLDCGLFLDHRKVRQWFGRNAKAKRFLNLYCYTAAATVHAALGGAAESVSIDLSQKYLAWAKENLFLNGCGNDRHHLERNDCSNWIDKYIASRNKPFDLIFFDPPTFSNSSSMDRDWDVQRDHESMIDRCMSILTHDGVLVFSNNFRRFRLSQRIAAKYNVQNKTRWSLQRDFSRSSARIHQCWFIRHQR